MLTKIKEGWWMNLDEISYFFIDETNSASYLSIKNHDGIINCSLEEGYMLEKLMNEYYSVED